jgi:hypothetical protein
MIIPQTLFLNDSATFYEAVLKTMAALPLMIATSTSGDLLDENNSFTSPLRARTS